MQGHSFSVEWVSQNSERWPSDEEYTVSDTASEDPMHGVTLQMMVEGLQERLGWEGLALKIPVKCFESEPSVSSSLKFLRKTPWAREKVELLYLYTFHPKRAGELAKRRRSPGQQK